MTFSRSFAMALVAATVLCVPAMADGPWWDPLNVTGSAKPKAAARKPAAKKESSWKLPGFGTDSAKKAPTHKKNEPSTLSKMNNSTKKFFAGAKDALTPWDNKKPAASKQPTGYGAAGGQKSLARGKKEEKDKGNILTSWWKDKEPEPKRPKTVPDFISGERP